MAFVELLSCSNNVRQRIFTHKLTQISWFNLDPKYHQVIWKMPHDNQGTNMQAIDSIRIFQIPWLRATKFASTPIN